MNELINKQLIFDYFAGNVTAFQRQLIDEWCLDRSNRELFYLWLEEWELTHLQYIADEQKGLGQYHDFLFNPTSTDKSNHANPAFTQSKRIGLHRSWLLWLVAASVAIIAVGLVFQQQLLNRTYSTEYGQTQTVALPDGSRVTLNANSTLRVPRFSFGNQTRQVWLSGEAQFSITHTQTNQLFVVKTENHADVVVLGTEFTLFARPRGTKIVLHRGKVALHYQSVGQGAKQVMMKPGERIDLNKNGVAQLSKTTQPASELAWKDHRYVFDQTSLREVTYLFQENFGMTIDITDPETAALTLSGAYPAQSADELLQIIAEALNIQIIRQNDKVLLAPKSYNQ